MVIVGFEWLQAQGWTFGQVHQTRTWQKLLKGLRSNWHQALIIAFIPLGLVAYSLYLHLAFGSPLAWLNATEAWGRDTADPITTLIKEISRVLQGETLGGHALIMIDAINIALVFIVLLMLPAIVRHVGSIYALYCLLSIALPLMSRSESMNRYVAIMFPVFIVLGVWGKRRWFDLLLKLIFLPILIVFTTMFVNWIFIG